VGGFAERLQELLAIFVDGGASHCLSRDYERLARASSFDSDAILANADLSGKLSLEVNAITD
jgi:hypothetical protein